MINNEEKVKMPKNVRAEIPSELLKMNGGREEGQGQIETVEAEVGETREPAEDLPPGGVNPDETIGVYPTWFTAGPAMD